MDLRHLRSFVTVVRTGGFAAAARELDYAQSTITLHMNELERELGAPLLRRERRAMVTTEAGAALARYAREMLRLGDDARSAVAAYAAGRRGSVRLGAIEPAAS